MVPSKPGQARDCRCFNCGKEGHIARNCDQVRLPKPSDPCVSFVEKANSVRANGKNSRKVYLEVLVDGEPVDCHLDTGSEVTPIPGSLVQELPKRRIMSQIRAANGTLIRSSEK